MGQCHRAEKLKRVAIVGAIGCGSVCRRADEAGGRRARFSRQPRTYHPRVELPSVWAMRAQGAFQVQSVGQTPDLTPAAALGHHRGSLCPSGVMLLTECTWDPARLWCV